jgi:hypothetical protein
MDQSDVPISIAEFEFVIPQWDGTPPIPGIQSNETSFPPIFGKDALLLSLS